MTATTYRRDTDQIGVTHTVRLSCDCTACEDNAARLGVPFPLAAYVTQGAADKLKITPRNADRATKTHGTVYVAHHPFFGRAQRLALPVTQAEAATSRG